ncbi:hypothetical protein HK096_002298 [Nowakowskiella sp. JEL0078]|nr:hypothetical protein HK096_002298 [Nowakowskiella sp. JEL0078]
MEAYENLEFTKVQALFGKEVNGESCVGDSSDVYKAIWTSLGADVAIKQYRGCKAQNPLLFSSPYEFEKNISLQEELWHPNLLQVIGICPSVSYNVVLEWVNGGTLFDFLNHTTISIRLAFRFAINICSALEYLQNSKTPIFTLNSHKVYLNYGVAKLPTISFSRPQILHTEQLILFGDLLSEIFRPHLATEPISKNIYQIIQLCSKNPPQHFSKILAALETARRNYQFSVLPDEPAIHAKDCAKCIAAGLVYEPVFSITDTENESDLIKRGDIYLATGLFEESAKMYKKSIAVKILKNDQSQKDYLNAHLLKSLLDEAEILTLFGNHRSAVEHYIIAIHILNKPVEYSIELNELIVKPGTEDLDSVLDSTYEITQEKKSDIKIAELNLKLALKRNREAQFSLGRAYIRSVGVPFDRRQGEFWLRMAILQDDQTAITDLATSYKNGSNSGRIDVATATTLYKIAGTGDAFMQLGNLYLYGIGVAFDRHIALQYHIQGATGPRCAPAEWIHIADYFRKAPSTEINQNDLYSKCLRQLKKPVEDGNCEARCAVGYLKNYGLGCSVDLKEAISLYCSSAESGYATSQANFALCYYSGDGIVKDLEKAVYWHSKAATQGHAYSVFKLGCSYADGYGVERNFETAVSYFKQAVELGHTFAENNLGNCYYNGEGVRRDYKKALECYTTSAEKGNDVAQYNLAMCYYEGIAVELNYHLAVYWLEKACSSGDSDSQYMLGRCYFDGQGVDTDIKKAVELFQKSADQSNSFAQNSLGECFLRGVGVDMDHQKAVELFKLSESSENDFARNNLANCYFHGIGLKRNFKQALQRYNHLHMNAAMNMESCNNFGVLHFWGMGVPEDAEFAVLWFRAAEELQKAKVNLAECLFTGIGTEHDLEEANQIFQALAEGGNHMGDYGLARMYLEKAKDVEFPVSRDIAFELMQKASAKGNIFAKVRLGIEFLNNGDMDKATSFFKDSANIMMKRETIF